MRTTRQQAEVLGRAEGAILSSKMGIEVLGLPTTYLRASRMAAEVLGLPITKTRVSRLSAEALGYRDPGLQSSRMCIEVLGRPKSAVEPYPYDGDTIPFFPLNWIQNLSVSKSWMTDIHAAVLTGAEERRSLRNRPSIMQKGLLSGLDYEDAVRLYHSVLRRTRGITPFPLYCDQILPVVDTGTNKITCDPTRLRAFEGQRICLAERGEHEARLFTIARVDNDGIYTNEQLPTPPPGSMFLPCFDAEISLGEELTAITDGKYQFDFQVLEHLGNNALPVGSVTPDTYGNYPIFKPELHWGTAPGQTFFRLGTQYNAGRGTIVETWTSDSLVELRCTVMGVDRGEAFEAINFFDYCRGQGRAFWMRSPLAPLPNYTANSATNVVEWDQIASKQDYADSIRHLCFTRQSGDQLFVPVTSIGASGGRMSASCLVPGELGNDPYVDVRPGYLMRFNSDELVENWVTDGVCLLTFSMSELVREGDFGVELR